MPKISLSIKKIFKLGYTKVNHLNMTCFLSNKEDKTYVNQNPCTCITLLSLKYILGFQYLTAHSQAKIFINIANYRT